MQAERTGGPAGTVGAPQTIALPETVERERTIDAAPQPMARRRFLRMLLGFSAITTLAMIVTPIIAFLIPPKTESGASGGRVPAGTTTDIPVGQGKVVAMGSAPVIVTNTSQGVKAFSAVCTHLGCIVAFDTTVGQIVCPCHGGQFNPSTGAVTAGPPPAPLKPVSVTVEKDQIFLVSG